MDSTKPVGPGEPLPLGATPNDRGVQFAVFSRHATDVQLLLFAHAQDGSPTDVIKLDPRKNRTGDVWRLPASL